MSKIRINTVLKTDRDNLTLNVKGILKDNEIIYKDNDVLTKLNIEKNILIRETNEYRIIMNFDNNKLLYYLKEFDKTLEDKIEVKKIVKKDNYFNINYIINDILYEYEISYEVEE